LYTSPSQLSLSTSSPSTLIKFRFSNLFQNRFTTLIYLIVALQLFLIHGLESVWSFNGWQAEFAILAQPFALGAILLYVLSGRVLAILTTVLFILHGALILPASETLFFVVTTLITSAAAIIYAKGFRSRNQIFIVAIAVAIATTLCTLCFGKFWDAVEFGDSFYTTVSIKIATIWGSAFFMAVIVNSLIPLIEDIFGFTSNLKWIEIADLNHPLMRQMQEKAPGTFQHSIGLATLTEAAAGSVGADPLVCRACCYFHDIGKLTKPEYFIENQSLQSKNPHDELTPSMSALIITSHVKDGVDLALQHKLHPRIVEVIQEHHGDSMTRYFYHKALEQREKALNDPDDETETESSLEIQESTFRYPGPNPTTLESGIICLGDAIESASRTLKKPTYQKIQGMVDDIVRSRVAEGLLDDCGITLSQLKVLRSVFARTINSTLHSRIDYPDADKIVRDGSDEVDNSIESGKQLSSPRISSMQMF